MRRCVESEGSGWGWTYFCNSIICDILMGCGMTVDGTEGMFICLLVLAYSKGGSLAYMFSCVVGDGQALKVIDWSK